MIIRDIQPVYCDELIIYHHIEKLYEGYVSNIPKELLNKKVVELAANFDSGMECAWIEVYV